MRRLQYYLYVPPRDEKYYCPICGYVYDPDAGDPGGGVATGTPFREVPDSWVCPDCGAAKSLFQVMHEMVSDLTNLVQRAKFGTALNGGFSFLDFQPRLSVHDAFYWAQQYHYYRLLVWDDLEGKVWEGRVEDIYPGELGMRVRAMGFWSSTFDETHVENYWRVAYTATEIIQDTLGDDCPAISTNYGNLQDTGLDIHPQTFNDYEKCGQVIEAVLKLGDNQAPPRTWYFAIWEDRVPYLFPKATDTVDWEMELRDVAAGGLTLSRSAKNLWNRMIALYSAIDPLEGPGARKSTSWAEDADSSGTYGDREYVLSLAGMSDAGAEAARDAALEDMKEPSQYTMARFNGWAWDAGKRRRPLYMIRAGDVLRIRDLVPEEAMFDTPKLDSLRTFFIRETEYDVDRNMLRVVPDFESGLLDIMIARESLR